MQIRMKSAEHPGADNDALKASHPAEEQGFPRVTQSDQQHSASDSFACEKVLQKHWGGKATRGRVTTGDTTVNLQHEEAM